MARAASAGSGGWWLECGGRRPWRDPTDPVRLRNRREAVSVAAVARAREAAIPGYG